MLKRIFASTLLVLYVFTSAIVPIPGYYHSAVAAEASEPADGEARAEEQPEELTSASDKSSAKESGTANQQEQQEPSNEIPEAAPINTIHQDATVNSLEATEAAPTNTESTTQNVQADLLPITDNKDEQTNPSPDTNNRSEQINLPPTSAIQDTQTELSSGTGNQNASAALPSATTDQNKLADTKPATATHVEEDKAVPFASSGTTAAGIVVQASAKAGVLPRGTTMHLRDVSSAVAKTAADQVVDGVISSAQGVDISFHNAEGTEIEPNGYVQVSIQLAHSLLGENFALIHVADNGAAENMGGATKTGASFASDEFSLYVLAGAGTTQDPISAVYREYTLGFGETITILSDERNHDGAWIPGVQVSGKPAWETVDVSGGNVGQLADFVRDRGTAEVQPRLVVTAKQKVGTIRVAFRYTHPEDRTHKTITGEFVATHYYLIHIVDKSTNSFSVQFRNNDGTGVSHVSEDALEYTTEEGVEASRTVDSNYRHTFTISEGNPSTRAGKVTLIMPEYPGQTTRTSGGKTYQFIGWSVSSSANPTDISTALKPIVYPHPDAHIFAPGDKFPLDRNVTLWAAWALQSEMPALFFIRIDDHIPNEPQSHGNASYTQIGKDITYKLPSALFEKDSVYGVDQGWDPSKRQVPWPAKIYSDLKAAGKLPDEVTSAEEFKNRYRVVWSTLKKENEAWHVDGILYEKALYNLAYHENGDLVVVSSMPEGVKDIQSGETTLIDTRIPNRYDMVFTGWNTEANGTGTYYVPGSSVVVSEHPELDTSINTLHLYAQWVKATKYTYTVRYLEAGTNKELKDPVVYGDQIPGNKVYSKAESEKSTSDISTHVFSYADPQIGSGDGCIVIGEDNSKNVITLYYMPKEEDILATALFINKTDEKGRALEGAEFTLTLNGSNESSTFISDSEGKLHIPFTKDPGQNEGDTLTYTLVESNAPTNYIKSGDEFTISITRGPARVQTFPGGISKTVYPLTAQVLRNGVEVDPGNITIQNKSKPDPIVLPITAFKVLEGRSLQDNEFTFELTDADGKQIATATNTAEGTIAFEGISVSQPGTYTYTIREILGDDKTITYDTSVYSVIAKVELREDNTLVSEIAYEKNGESVKTALFTNAFASSTEDDETTNEDIDNNGPFIITYDLNGGMFNGDTNDITEQYLYGTIITIHKAPTREGYKFLYWKGSQYQPGDEYTVVGNHRFVAQWEQIEKEPTPVTPKDPKDPKNPKTSKKPKTPDIKKAASTPSTSDNCSMASFGILAILSGAILIIAVLKRFRKSNDASMYRR